MRITFVALGWEQLGVSLLAAIAKQQGHDVNLAFSVSLFNDRFNFSIPSLASYFDDRGEVLKTIERQKPDVLAFSVLTGTYQWMLGIAHDAKRILPDVKVIFGGVHVSAVPDRVLARPEVDFVCIGEGDIAFPLILKAIQEGGPHGEHIPNTYYKFLDGKIIKGPQNGFIQDLNSLPGFDKILWENHIRIGDMYVTMASRGCPYRCTFCFNNFFANLPGEKKGKYVRQRSVEHMMQELRMAKRRYKLRMIDFEDDIFTLDKKWVKEFLDVYKKEINVPFQCLSHPKYIDENVSHWLAKAGCSNIQMGIQSMDDQYKFQTIKRYEKTKDVQEALRLMKKYKISAKVDHMFGLPGEPIEAQESARKLYTEYPPYRIQTFWVNFFPGTEMVSQGREMGLINSEDIERLNDGLGFDFYRNTSSICDVDKFNTYKAYEVIYKLIPILPYSLRRRLNVEFFKRLPVWLCGIITFMIDLLAGLLQRNPDHIWYLKHNLYHFLRFGLDKVGIQSPPATIPLTLKKSDDDHGVDGKLGGTSP